MNAGRQPRLIFAESGATSVPSSFVVPKVHKAFDENGKVVDEAYNRRIVKFLEEFAWYIEELKNQRSKVTPY